MSEYFQLFWDVRKIWSLNLPVRRKPIEEFLWHLDLPIWPSSPPESIFDLKPRYVLANLESFPDHKEKIDKADISYPIETMNFGKRLVILDGIHRLCKQYIDGINEISYRVIERENFDLIKRN